MFAGREYINQKVLQNFYHLPEKKNDLIKTSKKSWCRPTYSIFSGMLQETTILFTMALTVQGRT